jgi:hypothetical protein
MSKLTSPSLQLTVAPDRGIHTGYGLPQPASRFRTTRLSSGFTTTTVQEGTLS